MLDISWQNQTAVSIDQKSIHQHLESVLRRLPQIGTVKLEITIVRDKTITKLKKDFLGEEKATDVLSFPADQNTQADEPILGSIVISTDTALKQAKDEGVDLTTELKLLSTHGLLHLLGFHHR